MWGCGGRLCCSTPQYGWGRGGKGGTHTHTHTQEQTQEQTQERTRECCTYPLATYPLKSAQIVEIFCSATDGFQNWGVTCNTLIGCEYPHSMPQMTPNFCEWAPAQSILQKIIRVFCLRVDPNPQSQQRGRSFLCVTMFPGWHAKEYLCRFSE